MPKLSKADQRAKISTNEVRRRKDLAAGSPEHEDVKSVTLFVYPDRLSALVILANYARPNAEQTLDAADGSQVFEEARFIAMEGTI